MSCGSVIHYQNRAPIFFTAEARIFPGLEKAQQRRLNVKAMLVGFNC